MLGFELEGERKKKNLEQIGFGMEARGSSGRRRRRAWTLGQSLGRSAGPLGQWWAWVMGRTADWWRLWWQRRGELYSFSGLSLNFLYFFFPEFGLGGNCGVG